MDLIIPIRRPDPFDDAAFVFELKLDGFRGMADTVKGRMLSKTKNRMTRFEPLLGTLPEGFIFDGEICALDETGRPIFADLMSRKREPVYVPFDVLVCEGEDVRMLPLKERRALLEKVVRRYGLEKEKTELFFGEGRPLFNAVCRLDLEGIIAKRLDDVYGPKTKWLKISNPNYSQKEGRGELFERRYG